MPLSSPVVESSSRPPTSLSTVSESSSSATSLFEPLVGSHSVTKEESIRLRSLLVAWRDSYVVRGRDYTYLDAAVDFPDTLIKKLVDRAPSLLTKASVLARDVRQFIHWDSATEFEHEAIAKIIATWRIEAAVTATPKSQRRSHKKAREAIPSPSSADSSPTSPLAGIQLFSSMGVSGRTSTPGIHQRQDTTDIEVMFPAISHIHGELYSE